MCCFYCSPFCAALPLDLKRWSAFQAVQEEQLFVTSGDESIKKKETWSAQTPKFLKRQEMNVSLNKRKSSQNQLEHTVFK